MPPWMRAVSFISLLMCFKILYTLGWFLYVSCSKSVTNFPRKVFVFFLLLFWLVLCFFCIPLCLLVSLKSAICYMIFSLFLLIVLFVHPIFLNTFSYFVSLLFLNFQMLLILICFVSFSILSQCLIHFPLCCLSEFSLFGCTTILCFHRLAILL